MQANQYDSIRPVLWSDDGLLLLDQRRLPDQERWLTLGTAREVADAIRDMVVRGAPAIGVAAAYGAVLSITQHYVRTPQSWRAAVDADLTYLSDARPTAVNLSWAVERMRRCLEACEADPRDAALAQAHAIFEADLAANKHMGELGAALIEPDSTVLTHCNAGALATAGYGTALGVVRSAYAAGKLTAVLADETRPWLQGARLTAWELVHEDIPVSLIADGAASYAMRTRGIRWVIVGADRVAANGDVANKIGTYGLAVSARHHGVRFMVVAPTSTIDMNAPDGDSIPIEQRERSELLSVHGSRVAAEGADVWNPVFDVTPAALVDVLVTERGVLHRPDFASIQSLMATR